MVNWIPLSEKIPKPYEKVVVLCMDAPSPPYVPDGYHPTYTNCVTGITVDETGIAHICWEDKEMAGATHWTPADDFWADFAEQAHTGMVKRAAEEENLRNIPIDDMLRAIGLDGSRTTLADLEKYVEEEENKDENK